ncbi:MAG: 2'-5' RNA ligase family protein [bacterium]
MPTKSNSFNIAIAPPLEIIKKATRESQKLKNEGGLFVLNQTLYSSHLTIYMTEFPLKNIEQIKNLLKKISLETKSFKLVSNGYRQNPDGYIDVSYKPPRELKILQKKIITALNPLREGLIRKKDQEGLKNMKGQGAQNIKRYGSYFAFSNYRPHLTLTKLPNYKADALKKLKPQNFSFMVKQIVIFYLGEYGSCKKQLAKFNLIK